jgi:hypothetical protein
MQLGNSIIGLGLEEKSGVVLPVSFSGTPDKKATVTFTTVFPSTAYSVTLAVSSIGRSYTPTVESKTVSGFVINLNSNKLTGLAEIGWQAEETGEE